ncbi:MAG TPA: NAD(P)-binding domain-containing protein [Vicinamibacterales bacterium]|nr:NAD(P)-binding domain-containing protein [Vicinamibacterales bacterium]
MRIGIIGAGMIGSTLAKLWADAGHDVIIASRHPDELKPLVARIGARAVAGTATEAAALGTVVMLTVPLKAMPDLANNLRQELAEKVVLDTGNAYERRDGNAAREATAHPKGSAGWAAAMFPGARWVKAFNTVYFKTLETEAHRAGERVGIPLASDDAAALDVAAELVREAGFDPVIVGELSRGREFEPNTPMYNTGKSGRELREYFGVG